MKTLVLISRIITGLVFVFSGFVKAVDPLGSTYKFVDYFNLAFGMPWMASFAFVLAILLAAIEFLVGIMLIINVKPKLASLGALLFMIVFTPLTLYLAIDNPVHDCGCFGDALVITNWQTFWKNVVILVFVLIVFFNRKKIKLPYSNQTEWIIIAAFTALIIGFQFYNYMHLPVMDFRPYKVGTHIPEKMKIPEGAPADEYETALIYKNKETNEVKEFTMENYPWEDSTWVWVETKTKLIKEGYKPPIHDFSIIDNEGSDITELILQDEKPIALFVSYKVTKSSKAAFEKTSQLIDNLKKQDIKSYILTASPDNNINKLTSGINIDAEFCKADEITLKTIIRSNPGLVLLRKGTIIGKWHYNDYPSIEDISKLLN